MTEGWIGTQFVLERFCYKLDSNPRPGTGATWHIHRNPCSSGLVLDPGSRLILFALNGVLLHMAFRYKILLHAVHPSLAYALDVAIYLDKWIWLKRISEDLYSRNTMAVR